MAPRSSSIHSDSCCPTRRTHQARAWLRLPATPASIKVSNTRRSRIPSRVMAGTPAVVKWTFESPHWAPHDTVRMKAGCASSAMRTRAPRVSSRNPLMRACSATRTSSSPAVSASRGAGRVPTIRISSPSISIVGLPSNHASGTRPLNQAPIRRSCSGPEGTCSAERRRPRWGPLPVSVILLDYMITYRRQAGDPSREHQLVTEMGGHEAEPLVEAMGVTSRPIGGQLDAVATEYPGPLDRRTEQSGPDPCAPLLGPDVHRLDLGAEAAPSVDVT